jgi:hypothetical protein
MHHEQLPTSKVTTNAELADTGAHLSIAIIDVMRKVGNAQSTHVSNEAIRAVASVSCLMLQILQKEMENGIELDDEGKELLLDLKVESIYIAKKQGLDLSGFEQLEQGQVTPQQIINVCAGYSGVDAATDKEKAVLVSNYAAQFNLCADLMLYLNPEAETSSYSEVRLQAICDTVDRFLE